MPKIPQTKKQDASAPAASTEDSQQPTSSEDALTNQGPTSRNITADEVARLTGRDSEGPYTPTQDPTATSFEDLDYDQVESWFYPDFRLGPDGNPAIRPQKRVYQIIGRDGKPTGRLAYARSEVQAAALRQEVRDNNGVIYIPAARLVDIIYED